MLGGAVPCPCACRVAAQRERPYLSWADIVTLLLESDRIMELRHVTAVSLTGAASGGIVAG